MANIDRVCVGQALAGEGSEIAHVGLLIGPRGSAAENAFCACMVRRDSLLAMVAPDLMCKPPTIIYSKVKIEGAKQATQMFGPAQRGVALAITDALADGSIPREQADGLYLCVGLFIHWQASDDRRIREYNYLATAQALRRALAGEPQAADILAQRHDLPDIADVFP